MDMFVKVLEKLAECSLKGKMEEMEKGFKEKIYQAIKTDEKIGSYPEEFYQQMVNLAEDMYKCISDFVIKSEEKYCDDEIFDDYDDIEEIYTMDYESGSYDYNRLSQAKIVCKEAVKKAVSDAQKNYAEGKNAVAELCGQFLDTMDSDIREFLQEYSSSFDEYVSLDCERETEHFARRQKNAIMNGEKIYAELNGRQKIASLIEEVFDKPSVEILDVKKYFEECEYDEDDGYYCYNAEEVLENLNEDVRSLYETACEGLKEEMEELYKSMLYNFALGLSENLVELVHIGNDEITY